MTTTYRSLIVFVSTIVVGAALMTPVRTRSFSDSKEKTRNDSEPAKAVQGGVTFQVPLPYARAFETVVNALQGQHRGIDIADRQAGRISSPTCRYRRLAADRHSHPGIPGQRFRDVNHDQDSSDLGPSTVSRAAG